MSFGGNNRAQVFFKQHGWTDGGKIEAKYTSRAAELYKQLLSKEVAKSHAEDAANSFPSSPVETLDKPSTDFKPFETLKENPTPTPASKPDTNGSAPVKPAPSSIRAPSVKKPIGGGAKKTGKTGGLGARKLSTKVKKLIIE